MRPDVRPITWREKIYIISLRYKREGKNFFSELQVSRQFLSYILNDARKLQFTPEQCKILLDMSEGIFTPDDVEAMNLEFATGRRLKKVRKKKPDAETSDAAFGIW